jgi:hypothetical protein
MSSVRQRRLLGCQLVAECPLIVSNRLGENEPITSLINPINRLIGSVAKKVPYRNIGHPVRTNLPGNGSVVRTAENSFFKQEWVGSMRSSCSRFPCLLLPAC